MRYLVIGGVTEEDTKVEADRLVSACINLGETLRDLGHTLIICSPFKDSADYWVCKGFTKDSSTNDTCSVELHFVDTGIVWDHTRELEEEIKPTKLVKVPHPALNEEEKKAFNYSWLLSQLQALESCQAVIALGGKLNGSANMLLLLAEAKRKPLLPFSFLGGAAGQSFHRNRYQLEDKLGHEYTVLQDENGIRKALELSIGKIGEGSSSKKYKKELPKVFISYPRARPNEADYIETILRRRKIDVFRDESDFGAGHSIPNEIAEAISSCNIFVALWCAEYACSPWCYDELEIALDRQELGKTQIWILCIDDTRIVPTRARELVCYSPRKREEIEGIVLKLLDMGDN